MKAGRDVGTSRYHGEGDQRGTELGSRWLKKVLGFWEHRGALLLQLLTEGALEGQLQAEESSPILGRMRCYFKPTACLPPSPLP